MSERVLLDSEYFHITVDEPNKLVRIKRTTKGFASLGEMRDNNVARANAVEAFEKKGYRLLLDMRDAPMRNDPQFEEESRAFRQRLFESFGRVSILVRTAVGVLQVKRIGREADLENRGAHVRVFHDDEPAALAYLTEG